MKRQTLFLFLPIFLVFFVWGFQAGTQLDPHITVDSTNKPPELEKIINSLPNGQKSILIFIVSQLDTQRPKLIGVWLVSYMYTEPYATVVAIYPSPLQNDTVIDNSMVDDLKIRRVNGYYRLDDIFLKKLNETNIWSSGYVLIDLDGLTDLFVISGGKDNLITELSVDDLLNQIAELEEPSSSLIFQTLLLQQLCNKFTLVDSISEFKLMRDLFPEHISSNIDPDVLLGDWRQFINGRNGSFCVFPQKEILLDLSMQQHP
jgi:hypothetical protein